MRLTPAALRIRGSLALSLAGLVLVAVACGDDGHSHDHPGDDHVHGEGGCGEVANCAEAGTVELEAGLRVESRNGRFTVEVVAVEELSVLGSAYTVTIEDEDGNPVEDAQLSVDVFSIDCMHRGPDDAASVSADSQGRYALRPVHAHGGPWRTDVSIEAAGTSDEVRIPLCVMGDPH
jgi:hypothetical protein